MSVLFSAFLFALSILFVFFFNDTATTEIYTLSLHDALPISSSCRRTRGTWRGRRRSGTGSPGATGGTRPRKSWGSAPTASSGRTTSFRHSVPGGEPKKRRLAEREPPRDGGPASAYRFPSLLRFT